MTTRTDPGSYAVTDEPWDDFQATKVPLRTPYGPVTLHFLTAGEVFMVSGYEAGAYSGGHACGNTENEAFTWKGAEITGSENFRLRGKAWLAVTNRNFPDQGFGSSQFSARRGRNVTDKMTQDIVAYWSEVVRRYAAEHPHILAHAALRRSVRLLEDQEKAIGEAERQLAVMRQARTRIRISVHREFIAEHMLREPDGMDEPRPYHSETVNGFIAELANNAELTHTIQARRATLRTEVTS